MTEVTRVDNSSRQLERAHRSQNFVIVVDAQWQRSRRAPHARKRRAPHPPPSTSAAFENITSRPPPAGRRRRLLRAYPSRWSPGGNRDIPTCPTSSPTLPPQCLSTPRARGVAPWRMLARRPPPPTTSFLLADDETFRAPRAPSRPREIGRRPRTAARRDRVRFAARRICRRG